jgi:hypothetical protein
MTRELGSADEQVGADAVSTGSTNQNEGSTGLGVRRRAVVGAAWSAPLVMAASATPAYASATSAPRVTSTTAVITNGGRVNHTIVLTNVGSEPTTSLDVVCVLTIANPGQNANDYDRFDNSVSEGWERVPGTGVANGQTMSVTFRRTDGVIEGNGGTLTLQFVCVQPAPPVGSTTTTPVPTPGTGVQSIGPWA